MATVNDIYDSVARVVTEYGLEGVTIKRIAVDVNRSEALLYRYCKNKEDLLYKTYAHVASLILDRFTRETSEELEAIDDVIRRIAVLWKKYLKRLVLLGDLGYFYSLYSETAGLSHPEFMLLCDEVRTENVYYNRTVARMKSECEARGIPWSEISLMFANLTFLNIMRIKKGCLVVNDVKLDMTCEFIMNGLNGDFSKYTDSSD